MIALKLLAVAVLIAFNALFTAAHVSLVNVRHSRIRRLAERGDARARVAVSLLADPDRIVSGARVGMTIASLALGFIGATTLATLFRQAFQWFPRPALDWLPQGVAITLAFLSLIALHAVLGDLVPRLVSLHRAERMALVCARPFRLYLFVFALPIRLLDGISLRFISWLGIKSATGFSPVHSAEELQTVIEQAGRRGVLLADQERLILGAVELGRVQVREIMVPRPDVHFLPADASLDDVLRAFATTQRSRIPVFEGSLDQILGFVHIKDLLWVVLDRERRAEELMALPPFDLRRILRDVLIVPESKSAGELLLELRARRAGMALVVDEHGSILGLVTLEDVLEQLVGEIEDEFDAPEIGPATLADGALVFDAALKVRELESQHGIALPDDPAYETVGGFVLARLGFMPKGGESVEVENFRFTVLEVDRRRVARVKIQRLRSSEPLPDADSPAPSSPRTAAE